MLWHQYAPNFCMLFLFFYSTHVTPQDESYLNAFGLVIGNPAMIFKRLKYTPTPLCCFGNIAYPPAFAYIQISSILSGVKSSYQQ